MIGRARVVVVEDDRDLREIVLEVLKEAGLDAVGYADGGAALAALRGAPLTPAAILLDLDMPGMSGRELRDELLRDPALAAIPVVVASGADTTAIPAAAFLPKPYGVEDLCETLARVGRTGATA
jgi:CheY-like chemotaxis protein